MKAINFNSDFHPEFIGYIVEVGEGVWISTIEAKEIGKGHFRKLIDEFKLKYNWIKIPTPSNTMNDVSEHLGFKRVSEYFGYPFNCDGELMLWEKK